VIVIAILWLALRSAASPPRSPSIWPAGLAVLSAWAITEEKVMKVLMVITSHDQLGNTGRKTGFWLEELAAPYYVFKDAGIDITLNTQRAMLSSSLAVGIYSDGDR
jgi:hypothetical protein